MWPVTTILDSKYSSNTKTEHINYLTDTTFDINYSLPPPPKIESLYQVQRLV